ncbi:MAG: YitT family protein [Erysipelotrichaceae bacterium]
MNRIKRTMMVIVGSFIMGIGISIVVSSGVGSDPMSLFWLGLSKQLSITFGQANILVNIVFIGIVFFINRSYINIGSLLSPLVVAVTTDVLSNLFFQDYPFYLRVIICMFGFILLAFGVAYYSQADLGMGAYEALVFSIAKQSNIAVGYIRTIIDITLTIIGSMLGAQFGIGTMLAILLMGTGIQFFLKLLKKPLNNQE